MKNKRIAFKLKLASSLYNTQSGAVIEFLYSIFIYIYTSIFIFNIYIYTSNQYFYVEHAYAIINNIQVDVICNMYPHYNSIGCKMKRNVTKMIQTLQWSNVLTQSFRFVWV